MKGDLRTKRRVTVLMMSSQRRLEIVEVQTLVHQGGGVEFPRFILDEEDAEKQARRGLIENGYDESDFHYVGTLVAVTRGPVAGRMNWANPKV